MRKTRLVSALAALIVCLVASAGVTLAQEILTNDSVIAMKKAGLSDGVILAKIRSSQAKFDVGTQALVTLKQAGVSDPVIEAMVSHPGPGGVLPAAAPAPAAGAGAGMPQVRDSIYHSRGGAFTELVAASASIETSFAFFQSKSELVMKGRKAQYRIADGQPVFVSSWPANELPLVRLEPGSDHDDRNLKISSGSFMPYGGSQRQGIRNEDKIDVDSEKDPRGFYRIQPKKPLKPGEYGFVLTHGFAGGAAGKVYDFGID